MPSTKQPTGESVYQLKITLKHIRPPIWRRIQVPGDIDLAELHQVLQVAMGWTNSHLHQFIVGRTFIGEPHPDYGMEVEDERRFGLSQVARGEKAKFVYEYDFGDSWEHEILVEKILPAEAGAHYPTCLAGKRSCPPEDCGGAWGYADLLETIQNPDHPEHEDMLEWLGGSFDPEAFDLDAVNRALKRIKLKRQTGGVGGAKATQKGEAVPKQMKPIYEAVVDLTDAFCGEHLNEEYAQLCRQLAAALCRKRPSPLTRGGLEGWACGIVYALGSVNFLFDKSQTPHMSAGRLCELFGVSKSTAGAKSKQIQDMFNMIPLDPRWCLPSKLDDNPMAWLIQVNGLIVDARHVPRQIQEEAFRLGLIPYIPGE